MNRNFKERLVALIARLGHMDNIITFVGVAVAVILAVAVVLVLVFNSNMRTVAFTPTQEDGGTLTDPAEALVCIDPGHGYDDPGADSEFLGEYDESDINLSVSLKLRDILTDRGISVIMTRSEDSGGDSVGFLSPEDRVELANSSGATHYISIHCDSYTADPAVSGPRLYYYTGGEYSSDSFRLCRMVKKGITDSFGGDAAVKGMGDSDSYYVIRNTRCQSALLEMGFITNESDAASMLDPAWQDKMARSIADGIIKTLTQK